MSTHSNFAEPDLTPSHRKLLATDLLLILDDESSQKAPARLLGRKQEIINRGIKYFGLLHKGFDASRYGRYSVMFPEPVKEYQEFSGYLGSEAKSEYFPIQLEGYSKTLEALSSSEQPSPQKVNELKSFLKRIIPDYDEKGSSQSDMETMLKGLSYVSP